MAEFFTPSTTGEGQGGAQILSADFTPLNASGIVRGIERGAASLAKQREQQYEEEKERVKKQQELNSKIAKAREGTGVDIIDKGVQKIFENGMKNAYSLDNDDPIGTLTQTLSEMENFKKVTYQIYNKGVDESASKIEKAGGGAAYTGKLYEDVSIAPTFEKALNGNLYSDEELASKVEGGTLLSDLVSDLTIYESDPNFQYKFDVNKVASNVKKNLIDLYGSKSENLVSGADVGNRNVAIKIEDFTPESKKKMKQEAEKNSQLLTAYKNQIKREENLNDFQFEKKYSQEDFLKKFNDNIITPMFEGAERSVITDKKKESGLVEGEDYTVETIEIGAKGEGESTEVAKVLTLSKPFDIVYNSSIGDIDAEVKNVIVYINGGIEATIKIPQEKEANMPQTFEEKKISLNKNQEREVKAKLSGIDLNALFGENKTTRETLNEREAERRGNNPKVATEEDINNLPD